MTGPFFWIDGHNAIIGTSDAGKTFTAKWGVEEMLRQRRHTVIVDPLGVWYGLRSSADGTGPGFDIPIFGGPHGDVPIRATDGEAIGAIVVEQRVSAIIDLSQLYSGPEQRQFVRDLVARLRRRRDKANFHFVVDEADEFVPEKTRDDVAFALQEDMLWIAKKGRSSGWVQTLITQRTADISKSALSMSQTIIAHQLVSPQDQKPFLDWIRTRGTRAELAEIESSLPSLQRGERYLYSPRAHVLTREITPAISTFDSSKTPPPGQKRREPKLLAQLDVSAIARALAPPTGGSGASIDPAAASEKLIHQAGYDAGVALRKKAERIAELEENVAALEQVADQAYDRGVIAGIGIGLAHARSAVDALRIPQIAAEETLEGSFAREGGEVMPTATSTSEAARGARSAAGRGAGPDTKAAPASENNSAEEARLVRGPSDIKSRPAGAATLPPAQQNILDKLAWSCEAFRKPAIERQVLAIVIGVHPRTKGFLNNLGSLRSAGLIDYPEGKGVALTAAGVDQAERPKIAGAPLKDLRDQICKWLPAAQGRILRLAIDAFPNAIARDRLAELLNVHPRTKSLLNNIGRLRTLELLAGTPANLRAAPYLFGKD